MDSSGSANPLYLEDIIEREGYHPNGLRSNRNLTRPLRNDEPFLQDNISPDTTAGQLLRAIMRSFLLKLEPRGGWTKTSACEEERLVRYPIETVASHSWGLAHLVFAISQTKEFKRDVPKFDRLAAYEMALHHDLAELITGDITPRDGISYEEKHRLECIAMESIVGLYPEGPGRALSETHRRYEARQCVESRLVKDCDKIDLMLTGLMYGRQGFSGFSDFYPNSMIGGLSTKFTTEMALTIIEVRNKLIAKNELYARPKEAS